MQIDLDDWLCTIDEHYLHEFISGGGAAIKFVVSTSSETKERLHAGLRRIANARNFVFVAVDSAHTRTHLVDQLFFDIARQIEWEQLARQFLQALFERHGFAIPEDLSCRAVAMHNGRDELLLRSEVNGWLEKAIYRDYIMTQEFRLAMISMCRGVLDPDAAPLLVSSVREWLTGDLRLVTALRPALIFQRINRKNARHLLYSLPHWLRVCGRQGLVACLDTSRYTVSRRTKDDTNYYSPSAVIDGHEVLRQFVDGTDELEGCLIAVSTVTEFLTDFRRGMNCYDALRLRIADEVHDRARPNPFASLIQLASDG
jgi:hypothetical protein